MKVLEFEILERKYQISCPDKEEEILKACVALVDSRMKSLKTQGNFIYRKNSNYGCVNPGQRFFKGWWS